MGDKTVLALRMMAGGLVMGILADLLLRQFPWGLNVLLWLAALVATVMLLMRPAPDSRVNRWMLLAVIAFGACFAWRDSIPLKLMDLLAVLVALDLASPAHRPWNPYGTTGPCWNRFRAGRRNDVKDAEDVTILAEFAHIAKNAMYAPPAAGDTLSVVFPFFTMALKLYSPHATGLSSETSGNYSEWQYDMLIAQMELKYTYLLMKG